MNAAEVATIFGALLALFLWFLWLVNQQIDFLRGLVLDLLDRVNTLEGKQNERN